MTFQNSIYLLFLIQILINIIFFLKIDNISKLINIFDYPNNRKIHKFPVPLVGGTLIFLNLIYLFIFSFIFDLGAESFNKFSLIFGYTCFFFLGLYDDKYHIKALKKLFISVLILIPVLYFEKNLTLTMLRFSFTNFELNLGLFDTFITILFFLLFINAFNMFDGINCQNGIYSIVLTIALLFWSKNNIFLFVLLFTLIFFNYLNFKSKLFLGDSGSLSLGFLFSYFFVTNYNTNLIYFSDTIYLFMYLPGLDLMRLYILRLLKKKNPFEPDKNHIHHYFLRRYGYNKTMLIIICMIVSPIILNIYLDDKTLLINLFSFLSYMYFVVFKHRNNYNI